MSGRGGTLMDLETREPIASGQTIQGWIVKSWHYGFKTVWCQQDVGDFIKPDFRNFNRLDMESELGIGFRKRSNGR